MRDGTPVGQVRASMFVPAGYVKLEGATVNRSNYPRLVALANKYSLWTTDTANNPGKFGQGNGSTTMVLPNWTGRMAQFASTAGGAVAAGLPNITGTLGYTHTSVLSSSQTIGYGALYVQQYSNSTFSLVSGRSGNNFGINASLSNSIYGSSTTVQPPAINTFAIMRY